MRSVTFKQTLRGSLLMHQQRGTIAHLDVVCDAGRKCPTLQLQLSPSAQHVLPQSKLINYLPPSQIVKWKLIIYFGLRKS